MKNITKYKQITNRRYTLGKDAQYSGRETLTQSDMSGFSSADGYTGMSTDASAIRASYMPGVMANYATGVQLSVLPFATQLASGIGEKLAAKGAEKGAETLAGAAGGASKAAGTVSGIVGGVSGLYQMMTGIGGINSAVDSFRNDRLSNSQIDATSSTSTQSRYGVNYTTKSGVDEQGIMDYTEAQNRRDSANLTSSSVTTGMGAGAAAGAIAGSVIPGIGNIAGAAIGLGASLLGGLFGGLFGSSKAKREAERRRQLMALRVKNANEAIVGSNSQNESMAGSQGLRAQYNATHMEADKGKQPMQDVGLASHDEGMIDVATGETQYLGSANPTVKEPRKDNVPVGGPGFDDNVAIPGHLKDVDGVMFADKARPYFKANEMIKIINNQIDAKDQENQSNDKRDNNTKRYVAKKLDGYRLQTQQQYQQNSQAIMQIVDRQTTVQEDMKRISLLKNFLNRQLRYDKGTWSKIASTLNASSRHGLASPLLSLANGIMYSAKALAAADSQQPYAANSYVENATAPAALQILGGLGYDPSAQLAQMNKVAAQNRYAINQAGNLSAGQRLALSTAANNDLYSRRGEIMADAYNKNAAYKQAYAQALMQQGESSAQRQQQALATQLQMYAQAVGAKQKLQEQARKNWYTTTQQSLKDWNSSAMFNQTADLYNAKVLAEIEEIKSKISQGKLADVKAGDILPTYRTEFDIADKGKSARRFDGGFNPFSESIAPEDADAFRTNWINLMALNSVNSSDFDNDDDYYNAIGNAARNFGRDYDSNKSKILNQYNSWAEERNRRLAMDLFLNQRLLSSSDQSTSAQLEEGLDDVVNRAIDQINENAKKQDAPVRRVRKPIRQVTTKKESTKKKAAEKEAEKHKDSQTSSILPELVINGTDKSAKKKGKQQRTTLHKSTSSLKRQGASSQRRTHYDTHVLYQIAQQAAYARKESARRDRFIKSHGIFAKDPNSFSPIGSIVKAFENRPKFI